MTIVCNIWMICLELNLFVYDPSWMLHHSEIVWTLRSSVLVVFINFLLIDAKDRSKISSIKKRLFIALSLYPLSFFANTPFKKSFLTPLGLVRLYNSPKPYCSPSTIMQGNFHLSNFLRERFDAFFGLNRQIFLIRTKLLAKTYGKLRSYLSMHSKF